MPDIIHVHGWMAYLLPLYLKTYYVDEPLFKNSKIVTSLYNNNKFSGKLNEDLISKLLFDSIDKNKLSTIKIPSYSNLLKIAIENSDAIIMGTEKLPKSIETYIETLDKPVLDYQGEENFEEAYVNFYTNLLNKK